MIWREMRIKGHFTGFNFLLNFKIIETLEVYPPANLKEKTHLC